MSSFSVSDLQFPFGELFERAGVSQEGLKVTKPKAYVCNPTFTFYKNKTAVEEIFYIREYGAAIERLGGSLW